MGSFGAESVDRPPETIAYTAENGERAFYRRDADAERCTIFMNSSATGSHRSFFSATSSNATIPNVAGPGRILGNLLEAAGGSVERNIGLFAYKTKLHPAARAEQRLKDWSLSTEGDAGFLLRCLAASDRPSLQLAAFRVYIEYVIRRLTQYWLNDFQAIEGYRRLRRFFQKATRRNPAFLIARWKDRNTEYEKGWLLHYEAVVLLWSLDDLDSCRWIATQMHYLRTGDIRWIFNHAKHERFLVYYIGSWICREQVAQMASWRNNLFALVIRQVQLGLECEDQEGVDILATSIISRMLEDISFKPWSIYDDDYGVKNLFALIEQVRQWDTYFPKAYEELRKGAPYICDLFIDLDCRSSIVSCVDVGMPKKSRNFRTRFLTWEGQFAENFVLQGSKWSIRSWMSGEKGGEQELKVPVTKRPRSSSKSSTLKEEMARKLPRLSK